MIAEIDLAAVLKAGSPEDDMKRICSGAKGADVLQGIRHKGQLVSAILWESDGSLSPDSLRAHGKGCETLGITGLPHRDPSGRCSSPE
jgi:hypothetical protein